VFVCDENDDVIETMGYWNGAFWGLLIPTLAYVAFLRPYTRHL
jgi:hypothetical protein